MEISVPSQNAKTDTSLPVMNSSTTSLSPAAPNFFSIIISLTPFLASLKSLQINTPFPSAKPSAFKTMGYEQEDKYPIASIGLSNVS